MGDNTTHAALSPSARQRWGVCPGSVREEAKFPEQGGGAAADDGTRTHSLLERLVKWEFIDREGVCGPAPLFGTTVTDEFGTFTVDADRARRLAVALDWIRERVAEEPGRKVLSETKVFPDGFVGRADMSGTVDVQITGKIIYDVTDYKDGINPVQAVENPQLEQYALGVLAGLAPENYPKKFRLTVIQPKLAVKGMPVISSWEITTEELLARVEIIKAQAAATDDPNAPLVPGESQCKYCRARGSCPALAGSAMKEIGLMFGPVAPQPAVTPDVLPPDPLDLAGQAANKNPESMGAAELRQILEAAPLVRQFLDGVQTEVLRRLQSGFKVEGFKLVHGPGRRGWAFHEDEMVKKLTGMGIPKSEVFKQTLVSPAQTESLVWEKKGQPCRLSDKQLKRMESEYVAKTPGKLTVAPESDPRPAVVTDVSSMFAAVAPASPPALPAFLQVAPPTPTLPAWLS